METRKRTVAKTITFRIIATIATFALVLAFTDDFALAGTIGVLDFFIKLVLYYLHERGWTKIHWGMRST